MIEGILLGVLIANLIMAAYAGLKLRYGLTHFKMKRLMSEPSMLRDMPTVSVCVPARNEMAVMSECLEKLLASKYPKLEIIVFDDSSADNTSTLIKAFAHEGIRFVEGSPLPEGWLGKNHALQELLRQASGDYILFMDVDTRLGADTIEELMAYCLQEKAAMISVLPRREDGWRWSVIFGTLRYFWEIIFHRQSSPAVASNAWMIEQEALVALGGFESIKAMVQPEARLSAQLMAENKYRFLIGTSLLGVTYEKKWRSQAATSIRLLFPLLGGRIYLSVLGVFALLVLLMPFAAFVDGFFMGWSIIQAISGAVLMIFVILYGIFLRQTRAHTWWLGALLWPLTLMQEIVLLITSTERYLRHDVTWKGRSITHEKEQ